MVSGEALPGGEGAERSVRVKEGGDRLDAHGKWRRQTRRLGVGGNVMQHKVYLLPSLPCRSSLATRGQTSTITATTIPPTVKHLKKQIGIEFGDRRRASPINGCVSPRNGVSRKLRIRQRRGKGKWRMRDCRGRIAKRYKKKIKLTTKR